MSYSIAVINSLEIFNNINGRIDNVEIDMLEDMPEKPQTIVFLQVAGGNWATQRKWIRKMIENNGKLQHGAFFVTMQGRIKRKVNVEFPELFHFRQDLCRFGFPWKQPIQFWGNQAVRNRICNNNCRFADCELTHGIAKRKVEKPEEFRALRIFYTNIGMSAYSFTMIQDLIMETKLIKFCEHHQQI